MQATPPVNLSRTRSRDLLGLGVLPVMMLGTLSGLLGVNWDIAWHIDKGRDTFFTWPHNFIYAMMLVALTVNAYGLLRDQRDTPLHWRVGNTRLHPGLLIGTVSAALVLVFAPADELWHRFFGLDATLWGPMHLVGLTGFTLFSFAGLATSWLERELTSDARRKTVFSGLTVFFAATLLGNAVLLLAEYEFNIAQFDITFHPILLAGLTTFPLILIATLRPRTWSATMVTVVFTLIRLALLGWLTISNNLDLAGQSKPAIPLLILSGLVVDALISRRVAGWLAGLASGATTLAANDVMVGAYGIMPWTSSILMIGVPAGLILAAISGWMASRVAAQLEPSIKQPGVRA
jgi:hypothetical protein